MFLGSWFKGHSLGGERTPYSDLGLVVKRSTTAESCGSKARFIDIRSQPLSISSFSEKRPNFKTKLKSAPTTNSHLGGKSPGQGAPWGNRTEMDP